MKDKTQKLHCGCQAVVITSHCDRPARQYAWTEAVSLQELEEDLGPSTEGWFENLTREHELKHNDSIPANRPVGWSPCPAGGVVNLSASSSTPYHLKTLFHYDSPVMWPTLLPQSPGDTTDVNKSITSEEEEEAESSVASIAGWEVDGGDDRQRLWALVTDTSNDLSWTSSMATPPSTNLKNNPFPEGGEKEKIIARALFSPYNSGDDSALDEKSMDMTVEQEELSTSFLVPDGSGTLSASPFRRQEESAGQCANCRRVTGDPRPGETGSPCDCGRKSMVEVHCTDAATPHKGSGVKGRAGLSPGVIRSQQAVPESQLSEPKELHDLLTEGR
ncbi:uncharacterized protein LOC143276265 [Babylonia areolata]|uniref:uncharacterized protein LOC143276265 n=1 Tax=Babylonia areolata TaxID=304850 RepID=UPI003FD2E327